MLAHPMDHWQRRRADRAAILAMVAGAIGLAVVIGPHRPTDDVTLNQVADGAAQVQNASQEAALAGQDEPMAVSGSDLAHATERVLDARGRVSFTFSYGDGGFWLTTGREVSRMRDLDAALDGVSERKAAIWPAGDVAFVNGCCEGSVPRIDVVVRGRRPARVVRAGFDGIAEIDVDVPRGRLLLGSNGDAGFSDVVRVPAGRYRLRVSGHHSTLEGSRDEAFRFELWPAGERRPPAVLLPRPF